ncbi:2-hydroxyisoflavanone dehydratase-like [Silene latifolia]|uniref:2-hydroxyisoflavanone dehydratase-like n=1 Tax=Silene latifolia TaxID=37657 RepID=UPI003D781D48
MDTETTAKEVKVEFPGLIRVYEDNSVERLYHCPTIPPSLQDPQNDVASKDVIISTSTGISARLYLPKPTQTPNKFPILVYFHGGGFCIESAFSTLTSRYTSILSSQAQVIVVSVEYRLAPEHPLPTAYEDCWAALNWVASVSDPWLKDYAAVTALFIGGDSSGANIVHNIAMKAGTESLNKGVEIRGAFLSQGFFLDEKIDELEIGYKIWEFVYPDAPGGRDSWMINPMGDGAPSLAGLGCSRVLVIVASDDVMRGSGVRYYNAVKESEFNGQAELFQVQGEGHGFHVYNPHSQNAKLLFNRLASFFNN